MKRLTIATVLVIVSAAATAFILHGDRVHIGSEYGPSLSTTFPAENPSDQSQATPELTQGSVEPAEDERAVAESAPVSREEREPLERQEVPSAGWRVSVLDAASSPIAGAVVSWTANTDQSATSFEEQRIALRGLTRSTTTDDDGIATFDAAPELGSASVVWVSHPAHMAQSRLLAPEAADSPAGIDIELESAAGIEVLAIDATGAPVPGALIEQFGAPLEEERWLARELPTESPEDRPEDWIALAFERQMQLGEDGRGLLHPCPLVSFARARAGELLSEPRRATPAVARVVLQLASAARAEGTVHLPAGFGAGGAASVSCMVQPLGSVTERDDGALAHAPVRADGSWGPLDLPARRGTELLFRVDGGGLVPEERAVPSPEPGQHLLVDFHPELGQSVPVRAFDAATDAGVRGARAAFWWAIGNSEYGRVEGWTDGDGRVELTGCPQTTGFVRVEAAGYRSKEQLGVGLPRTVEVAVGLERGGVLRGLCHHRGEPVEHFDVVLWTDDARARSVHPIQDAEDGRFEIREAPLGQVQILAFSLAYPESAVQEVRIDPDEPAEVEIELPAAVVGVGRVVDAVTSEPIAEARIVPHACSGWTPLTRRGSSFRVDGDGSFELEIFPPKNSRISVEAPGYAPQAPTGSLRTDGVVDFGQIGLARSQTLTVRLVTSTPFDASHLWFQADGIRPIPYVQFPPSGELSIPDVAAGDYSFFIVWQSGETHYFQRELIAGPSWVLEVPFDPEPTLAVEVIPASGEELPADGIVQVDAIDLEGTIFSHLMELPSDGQLVFHHCPSPALRVEVLVGGTFIGAASGRFRGGEERRIRVELGASELNVVVIDGDGIPLPETQVKLYDTDPAGLYVFSTTDGEGRTRFAGIPPGERFLGAYHPIAGYRENVPVTLGAGANEVTVKLDATQDLRLLLADRGLPVPGAKVTLFSAPRKTYVHERSSGPDGIALFGRVAPGRYQTHIDHVGCWPSWHEFEFVDDAAPVEIPVLRLGNLRLRLSNSDGLPLAGIPVTLSCTELDESVSSWVAAHLVHAEPAGLTTDAKGELYVQGLPRGEYVLAVTSPSSSVVQASISIPAQSTLEHAITLE